MIGTIAALWRYPIKSMLGERRESLLLERRGVVGDRLYAIRDQAGKFGSGKTTRRFRLMNGLYRFRSHYDGETPVITFPDGDTLRGDDPAIHTRLSDTLGINVELSREADISHFDDGPIHLVTTASLRALGAQLAQDEIQQETDARRFRPNIVVETNAEGFQEDSWEGREILLGDAVRLRVTKQTERCVMVNFAWDELREEPRALRALAQTHDACMGVYADVLIPGLLRTGAPVRFADEA
jgi:uncharacterized protein YcbX